MSESKMQIELKLKPLSKEEVERKLQRLGYDTYFEEVDDENPPFGNLVVEIAKLLVSYHEDPDIALEKASEVVFNWVTKELLKNINSTIGSFIEEPLDGILDYAGREDLKQELKKMNLW